MARDKKSTLDLDSLNFNNIKGLISTDTAGLSYEELEARHHTLMDRLLARQLAKRHHQARLASR